MRIAEVITTRAPMSAAEYAAYAQQRDAEQQQAAAGRRQQQQARQQALQQAQVAKSKQTIARPIKFGKPKRRVRSRRRVRAA